MNYIDTQPMSEATEIIERLREINRWYNESSRRVEEDFEFRSNYTNSEVQRRHSEESMDELVPPLLLRTYRRSGNGVDDVRIDILEAKNNIFREYLERVSRYNVFSRETIEEIIENHSNNLSSIGNISFTVLIDRTTYHLSYDGRYYLSDINSNNRIYITNGTSRFETRRMFISFM